jgi:hypothetical protein
LPGVVEQASVAGAEFTTFYYYTILRVNSIGFDGEGLKEIIEDARIEDRNHFEALAPRIYELGGTLPRDNPPVRRYRRMSRRIPSAEPARHEADAERAGGSGALRHPDLRYGAGDSARRSRARSLVLGVFERRSLQPLPPRQARCIAVRAALQPPISTNRPECRRSNWPGWKKSRPGKPSSSRLSRDRFCSPIVRAESTRFPEFARINATRSMARCCGVR